MFPITDAPPASARLTSVLPKGHNEYAASFERLNPERDRDDEEQHYHPCERVGDGEPEAGQDQPDDVEQRSQIAFSVRPR
jgi:hypothetical protein